jgi:protein-S-isoprenylcysteine O-methyltransferase Ste14
VGENVAIWTEALLGIAATTPVLFLGYVVFRVIARRDYERYDRLNAGTLVLEFIMFAVHANLSYIFLPATWPELPLLPNNPFQLVVGLGLIAIGISLTLWAMAGLGFKHACGQPPDKLHIAGFYRWSRNPQLVFYALALLGFLVLWPAPFGVIWLLVYAVFSHWMVRSEEAHLTSVYGAEYQRYCEQVNRYLPRLLSC